VARRYCCFFFQAEDGIRDRNVTGVQTCALPISRPARRETRSQSRKRARAVLLTGRRQGRVLHGASGRLAHSVFDGWSVDAVGARSEERRVGKACRAGGSTEQRKRRECKPKRWSA